MKNGTFQLFMCKFWYQLLFWAFVCFYTYSISHSYYTVDSVRRSHIIITMHDSKAAKQGIAIGGICPWGCVCVCVCVFLPVHKITTKLLIRNWCCLVGICVVETILIMFDLDLWPWELFKFNLSFVAYNWDSMQDLCSLRIRCLIYFSSIDIVTSLLSYNVVISRVEL